MWLVLLKDLKAYIEEKDVYLALSIGATGKKPGTFPAMYFIRGKETNVDFHQNRKGTCVIVVEIWEKATETNPQEAYEKLAVVEEKFCNYLDEWSKLTVSRTGVAAVISISSFRGDGEANRPLCASQAFILIEWRRS
jgi:hypothetical protein